MATILSFPDGTLGSEGDLSFVNDADTLCFDDDARDVVLPPEDVVPDWTNQELADLYRVKNLLERAGVACEADRGLSDEGDPWFVLIDLQGDVFIHLCRIQGLYTLDSTNLPHVLRGAGFSALIADYTQRVLGEVRDEIPKVVHLRAGNGHICLHPSVLLAALVWTLVAGAQDAVALPTNLPSESSDDTPATHPLGGPPAAAEASSRTEALDSGASDSAREDLHQIIREHGQASPNVGATGLSSIALAIGLLSDRGMTSLRDAPLEDVFLHLHGARGSAEADASADHRPDGTWIETAKIEALEILIEIMALGGDTGPSLVEAAQEPVSASLEGTVLAQAADVAPAGLAPTEHGMNDAERSEWDLSLDIRSLPTSRKNSPAHSPNKDASATVSKPQSMDAAAGSSAETHHAAGSSGRISASTDGGSATPAPGSPKSLETHVGQLDDFMIGHSLIRASFEVTESMLARFGVMNDEPADAVLPLEKPDASPENLSEGQESLDIIGFLPESATSAVRATVAALLAAETDFEIAESGKWFWLVEEDAQYAPLDQTMSFVHDLADGSRVMITGLQTTFAEIDLLPA